jgi:hypothetical protein
MARRERTPTKHTSHRSGTKHPEMNEPDPSLGGARRPTGVPTLYHYTSIESMIAIFQSRRIRLSSASTMNDTSEGEWLLGRLIEVDNQQRIEGRERTLEEEQTRAMLLRLAFREGAPQAYLACFSEKGDLLSQWRAYARDGEGVAIGFDPNDGRLPVVDAPPHTNAGPALACTLNRVTYGSADLVAALDVLIHATVPGGVNPESFFALQMQLSGLRWLVKNPAFQEEHEWRIVNLPLQFAGDVGGGNTSIGALGSRGYRQAGNRLVSFYEMPYESAAVTDLVLGPGCAIHDHELALLLHDCELTHVRVHRSEATYRR